MIVGELAIIVLLSYALGSIPFAVITGRIWKGIDIREHGSRNAGFTNVYRVIGLLPAAMVLVLDVGKGVAAVLLPIQILPDASPLSPVDVKILAALCVILGHVFPLFARFRGGKGIATGLGALLSIIPLEATLALVLFVLIVAATRYVSLGSLSAAVFIFLALVFERYYLRAEVHDHLMLAMLFLNGFVFFNHRGNIRRLLTGTENKFGRRKKQEA
jgi:glycerol-3-phosphate acyltransferase PlsY